MLDKEKILHSPPPLKEVIVKKLKKNETKKSLNLKPVSSCLALAFALQPNISLVFANEQMQQIQNLQEGQRLEQEALEGGGSERVKSSQASPTNPVSQGNQTALTGLMNAVEQGTLQGKDLLKAIQSLQSGALGGELSQINKESLMNSLYQLAKKEAGKDSNANNLSVPMNLSVNDNTRALSASFAIKTSSPLSGAELDLSLSYSQGGGASILGMPKGWSYSWLSYLNFDSDGSLRLHIAGQTYVYDTNYTSGLRYYTLKNMRFESVKETDYPYDTSLKYSYRLLTGISPLFKNGTGVQYFDRYGKLVGYENTTTQTHVTIYTETINPNKTPSIDNVRLNRIVDASNLSYSFTYQLKSQQQEMLLGLPDGRSYQVAYNTEAVTSITDPLKRKTELNYRSIDGLLSEIRSPEGGRVIVVYDENGTDICLTEGSCQGSEYKISLPAVSQTLFYASREEKQPIVTTYTGQTTDPNGGNYTGFPHYSGISGSDSLLESNDDTYRYTTTVLSPNGTKLIKTYNRLHLLLNSVTVDKYGSVINLSNLSYNGESQGGTFPDYKQLDSNYQVPAETQSLHFNGESRISLQSLMENNGRFPSLSRLKNQLQQSNAPSRMKYVKTDFNEYGEPTHIYEYETIGENGAAGNNEGNGNGSSRLIKETIFTQDADKLVTREDIIDYKEKNQNKQRSRNEKTYDSQGFLLKEKIGLVVGGQFTAYKSTDNTYTDVNINGSLQKVLSSQKLRLERNAFSSSTNTIENELFSGISPNSVNESTVSYAYMYRNGLLTKETRREQEQTPSVEMFDLTKGVLLEKWTPSGLVTSYKYDDLNRVLSERSPSGITTFIEYEDLAEGGTKETRTSANRYKISTYKDALGRETKQTDNLGSSNGGERVLKQNYYGPDGQLLQTKDAFGRSQKYTYDAQGRQKEIENHVGQKQSFSYNDVTQTREIYLNGRLSSKENLDDQGNKIAESSYAGSNTSQLFEKNQLFNAKGFLLKGVESEIQSNSSLNNSFSSIENTFDIEGLETNSSFVGSDELLAEATWQRDVFGNTVQKNLTLIHSKTQKKEESKGELRTYNALNQLVKECNALNQCKLFWYNTDGKLLSSQDYAGTLFTYDYTPEGKLKTLSYSETRERFTDSSLVNFLKGLSWLGWAQVFWLSTENHTVKYQYDEGERGKGELLSIEQDGEKISYTYYDVLQDGKQGLKSITYPDGKQVQFDYDSFGRITFMVDVAGNKTEYFYENAEDPSLITTVRNGKDWLSFTYYSQGDSKPELVGQIKSVVTSNSIQTTFSYYGTAADDVEVASNPNNYLKLKESKSYRLFSGGVSESAQGSSNLIQGVRYTYGAKGNILSVLYSSEVSRDTSSNYAVYYEYNSLNELVAEKLYSLKQGQTPGSLVADKMFQNTTYSYDVNLNVTGKITVDSKGNIIDKQVFAYDADNKILKIENQEGSFSLEQQRHYDANSNLILDHKGNTYSYNKKNQLIRYKSSDGSLSADYSYYPNGLRKSKQLTYKGTIQAPITFYYDNAENANVINEIQGNQVASYLLLGNTRYARYVNSVNKLDENEKTASYYLKNHKDTTLLSDEKGNIVKSYNYEPYGSLRNLNSFSTSDFTSSHVSNAGKTDNSNSSGLLLQTQEVNIFVDINTNPFLYSSEYMDLESGLQYLRARYYKPDYMHFIQRDSDSRPRNKFFYTNANPIMETDPSGNFSLKDLLPHSTGGWIGLGVSTIAGSVLGGLSVKFIWALASGAIVSASGTAAEMAVDGKGFDKTKLAISAIEDAIVASLFYGVGYGTAYLKKQRTQIKNLASENLNSSQLQGQNQPSLRDRLLLIQNQNLSPKVRIKLQNQEIQNFMLENAERQIRSQGHRVIKTNLEKNIATRNIISLEHKNGQIFTDVITYGNYKLNINNENLINLTTNQTENLSKFAFFSYHDGNIISKDALKLIEYKCPFCKNTDDTQHYFMIVR
jgi:RHS repeat-associated protein